GVEGVVGWRVGGRVTPICSRGARLAGLGGRRGAHIWLPARAGCRTHLAATARPSAGASGCDCRGAHLAGSGLPPAHTSGRKGGSAVDAHTHPAALVRLHGGGARWLGRP